MIFLSIELVALIAIAFIAGFIVVCGLAACKRALMQKPMRQNIQEPLQDMIKQAQQLPDIAPHPAPALKSALPPVVVPKHRAVMAEARHDEKQVEKVVSQKVEPRFEAVDKDLTYPAAEPLMAEKPVTAPLEEVPSKHIPDYIKVPEQQKAINIKGTIAPQQPKPLHHQAIAPEAHSGVLSTDLIKEPMQKAQDSQPIKVEVPIAEAKTLSIKAEKKARERALIAAAKSQPFIDSDDLKLGLF